MELFHQTKAPFVLRFGIFIVRKLRINIDLFKKVFRGLLHNGIKMVP
ncbi:MAG TPA: hypothetical protein VK133_00865 [Amoebophilaceae bacterium]|nr:hypothetical protein [Amoebophilaceae bacterium]